MASTRISYNTSAFGAATKLAVSTFIKNRQQFQLLKSVLDSIIGAPADYSQIETQLGVPVGKGQAFYDDIGNTLANINLVGNYIYDIYQGD